MAKKISTEPCAAIQNPKGLSSTLKLKSRAKNATQKVTLPQMSSRIKRKRFTRFTNSACDMVLIISCAGFLREVSAGVRLDSVFTLDLHQIS